MRRKQTKIIEVKDITSEIFTTKKDFNKQYKEVKENFKNQLGFDIMKQGLITLCINTDDNKMMKITSSTKSDMLEYMDKFKNREFFLFIKGQNYLVKGDI